MNVLPDVPAVRVPTAVKVSAPFRFKVPVPPPVLISITLDDAAVPVPEKVIPPLAFKVPVVVSIFATRVPPLLLAGKLINPETVAVAALMFQAVMKLAVG